MKDFYEYKNSIGDRVKMYRNITKAYDIHTALYPGSHIDIMPSFVIPNVVYVDNFKGTVNFFKNDKEVLDVINKHKEYMEPTEISFINKDYTTELDIEPVDLLISQYAGFVGQKTKDYLKVNGILLCNDSHGDATLAYLDDDYEFKGVVLNNLEIKTSNLDKYFTFKRTRDIDRDKVLEKMRGPKYANNAYSYIFRKIK